MSKCRVCSKPCVAGVCEECADAKDEEDQEEMDGEEWDKEEFKDGED